MASAPAAVCAIPGCALWAELDAGWCRSHHARWRQHGRPPTAEFIAHCVSYGEDRFDLRALPPQLRLEIGYALQCRVDANRTRTTPRSIKPLLDHLVASGAESLLERPLADWLAGLPAAAAINTPRAFLGYAIECLLDLRDGTGWDSEYERDVWLLRRLGVAGHDGARLDFTAVQPLWLRELAKRWCRWRMSCGVGLGQLRKDRIALVRLSRLTPGLASSTGPNALDRAALEGYLARLAVELPHPKTRSTDIGCRDRVSACRAPAPLGIAARGGAAVSQRPSPPRRDTGTAGDSRVRPAPARRPRQPRPDQRPADPAAGGDPHPHRTAHRRRHPAGAGLPGPRPAGRGLFALPQPQDASRRGGAHRRRTHRHDRGAAGHAPDSSSRPRVCCCRAAAPTPTGGCPSPPRRSTASSASGSKPAVSQTNSGEPVHVTAHQFRHSYATRLINHDVPQEVVRRLLDHTSHTMTAVYARLADTTIREQWERAQKINIRGEPVDTIVDGPLADGEWMKQNLARAKMALPNGYCGLPLQKSCPHANACLTCPLFITTAEFLPQHRKQLDDTRALIARAETDGHTRLAEMNRTVETNLLTIITTLEADQRDCRCAAAGSETCCGKESSDAP